MQFCRQILGVQKTTTNVGVLLELGRTPLSLEAQKLSLKNWGRIKNKKGNILVTKSQQNACDQKLDWNETIASLLSKYDLRNLLTEPKPNIGQIFLSKARDEYQQQALTQIARPDSKLRTYALLKSSVEREDYLVNIRNTRLRQTLTKFRLSNHKLMIERGRHLRPKLDIEERICPVCQEGVEDETHFLVRCTFYEELRKPLLEHCVQVTPQFELYSEEEQFVSIMTNPLMMGKASKFLEMAFDTRETHIDVSTALSCVIDKVIGLVGEGN